VLAYPTSGTIIEPVPVTLDRPFIYRITDATTGATLFIGQIQNPSAYPPAPTRRRVFRTR
jgi:serine protease inhibitor